MLSTSTIRNMIALAVMFFLFLTQPVLSQQLRGELTKTQQSQLVLKCKRDCATVCRQALTYVNEQGAKYALVSQSIRDCLKVCEMSADLQKHNSKLHCKANELCIDACQKCMAACAAINDKKLKNCIDACRTLAIELSYEQLDQLARDIDTLIAHHEHCKLISPAKSQELKSRLNKIEAERELLRASSSPSLDAYTKLLDEANLFAFQLKRDLQSSVGGVKQTGPLP